MARLSLQLYTLRDLFDSDRDATFAAIACMGLDEVEPFGIEHFDWLPGTLAEHGLSAGSDETGTEQRFDAARRAGLLSEESFNTILGAYRFIASVRYRQQQLALRQGLTPNNRIAPDQFGSFERKHLKDAFRIIADLQDFAKLRFLKE